MPYALAIPVYIVRTIGSVFPGGHIESFKAWISKEVPLLSFSFCMLLVCMLVSTFFAYLPYGSGLAMSSCAKLGLTLFLLFLPTILSAQYDEFSSLAFCNVIIGWIPPVWIGLLIWGYVIRRRSKKEGMPSSAYDYRQWLKPVLCLAAALAALSLTMGWLVYRYYLQALPDTYFAAFFSVFEWHFILLVGCFVASLLVAFIPKLKTRPARMLVVSLSVLLVSSFVFASNLTLKKQGEHRKALEHYSSEVFRALAQEYQEKGSYPISLAEVEVPVETPAVFRKEGVYKNHGDYFELYLGTDYQALRFDSRIGVWQTCIGDSCY